MLTSIRLNKGLNILDLLSIALLLLLNSLTIANTTIKSSLEYILINSITIYRRSIKATK